VKSLSAENLDLAARRGAQIYARCEAGQPIDPSASFREAKPLPPPAVIEVGDEPTRLSLLVEFAYRCEQEAIDHLLMYELIHGNTKVCIRGEKGVPEDSGYVAEPGHVPMTFGCLERLIDGSQGMLVFTDYRKLVAYQGEGPCLEVPSAMMFDYMDKLNATSFILNSGTPACYSMRRRPEK
jgi:hypothetical protein